MPCGSSNLCLMESPQYIDGGECPPACVTADQLVLWEELGLNDSVDLGLPLDILIEFPSQLISPVTLHIWTTHIPLWQCGNFAVFVHKMWIIVVVEY